MSVIRRCSQPADLLGEGGFTLWHAKRRRTFLNNSEWKTEIQAFPAAALIVLCRSTLS